MRSFFLGTDFKTKRLSANVNRPGFSFLGTKSASVTADPVTKETKDFLKVTRQIIANLEGGYYNPIYHNAGPLYATSGETMFGVDRKTGGDELNASADGKAFWAKIEAAQKDEKWRYNYIPPDPLQGELVTLAAKMLKVRYERLMKAHIKDKELRTLIESDGRLLFNFIYACWNGDGWFKKFAERITNSYKKYGVKNSGTLTNIFVETRQKDSNELIYTGGNKIRNIILKGGGFD